MGLADEVATYHRVNKVTVYSPSAWELSFPRRPGMPDHGHTVSRDHLDTVLLKHAESAGAEVRQGAEVAGPEFDANGRVVGVVLKSGEKVLGDAVIAADGAYSPIKRALKLDSAYNGYSAIAIRSEMHPNRPDNDSLDIYLKLLFQGDQLPGYGWVFPMGSGVFNIGLGYVNSYKNWQSINATQFLGEFLRGLPAEWEAPRRSRSSRRTRASRPGDCRWASRHGRRGGRVCCSPATRWARVSSASGARDLQGARVRLAAGECAVAALNNGGPDDFTNYAQRMEAAWGQEYRRGRYAAQVDRLPEDRRRRYQAHRQCRVPGSAAQVAVQEGTGSAAQGEVVALDRPVLRTIFSFACHIWPLGGRVLSVVIGTPERMTTRAADRVHLLLRDPEAAVHWITGGPRVRGGAQLSGEVGSSFTSELRRRRSGGVCAAR